MLKSILDAKITTNVVRLGSRTTDEHIAQYSLHKLEQDSGRGGLDRTAKREFAVLKKVEEEITGIMNKIQLPQLSWEYTKRFLDDYYPEHAESLTCPPSWIAEVFRRVTEDENEYGQWIEVPTSRNKRAIQNPEITGIYGFWKGGRDLEFIQLPSGPGATDPLQALFDELRLSGEIPPVPSGKRPLERLIESDGNVWSMSLPERKCLAQSWEDKMCKIAYDSNVEEFSLLKERYKDACKDYEDAQDEVSRLKIHSADY